MDPAQQRGGDTPAGRSWGLAEQDLRPSGRDAGFDSDPFGRDMSNDELVRLFQRTETQFTPPHEPAYDWSDQRPVPAADLPADVTGPNRFEEELRGLADARPGADLGDRFGGPFADLDTPGGSYEERHTGIERRWDEDDM